MPAVPDPDEVHRNREATLPLIVEEALRQRRDQDERHELLQRVTGLFLGIFLPASGLVAFSILGLDGNFAPLAAWMSVGFFVLGLASSIMVFWPRRWETGPNIRALVEGPFRRGDDELTFRFGLLMAHDRAYETNERRVRFGGYMMKSAIAFFVLSLVSLGVGVLQYDEVMSGSDYDPTENPTSQSEPDQVASPDQAVPPLPDVEPVRPTYAERGQNYHFETRPGRDALPGRERHRT